MEEKKEKFYGTFFDKSATLNIAKWAGILAWVLLGVYVVTTSISFAQFINQFATGVFYQKGMSIVDLLGFFTPYLHMIVPGIVYFFGLKFVEHALLILLDLEESARRASRK